MTTVAPIGEPSLVVGSWWMAIALLGDEVQLSLSQYGVLPPRAQGEIWHVDGGSIEAGGRVVVPPEALLQVKAAIALHDLHDHRRGGTMGVPGSHRLPSREVGRYGAVSRPPGAVAFPLAKGDACVFHPSLWHSSGVVQVCEPRYMLFYGYNRPSDRPYEVEPDRDDPAYQALSTVQRRLLRPHDWVDPADARFPKHPTVGRWHRRPRPPLRELVGLS
jgi:hypothetical protein